MTQRSCGYWRRPRPVLGERFHVTIVPLDEFDNEVGAHYEDNLTLTNGTRVWRTLPVTGSRRITVSLGEPGIHRFRFTGSASNAIRIDEKSTNLFWGDAHVHTGLSHDRQGADPYRYARDVSALDFDAVTDHVETLGEIGDERILKRAQGENDPGRASRSRLTKFSSQKSTTTVIVTCTSKPWMRIVASSSRTT